MDNNTFNWKKQKIENQAKTKLLSLSKEEIKNKATKYKTLMNITNSILGAILLIGLAVLIVVFINSESRKETPFSTTIIAFIILGCLSIFPFIMLFIINRKSNEELALLQLKIEIRKSICKLSQDQPLEKMINENFVVSKKIFIAANGWKSTNLLIDNEHKLFIYQQGENYSKTYNFTDLVNYEVYENGESKVKGRAGSALIGGAFFGLTGLIVGSSMSRKVNEKCNQLKLIIRLNDLNRPQIVITYIDNVSWDKTGFTYRAIKENIQTVCSALEYIINAKTLEQSMNIIEQERYIKNDKPLKEQLQELLDLLNDGLITQEEFEQKKKQILNL